MNFFKYKKLRHIYKLYQFSCRREESHVYAKKKDKVVIYELPSVKNYFFQHYFLFFSKKQCHVHHFCIKLIKQAQQKQ